jgi:hypothetical protein
MLVWFLLLAYVVDTYYDNKYSKQLFAYKKQFKLAMIVFGIFSLYLFTKKNPAESSSFMQSLNGVIRYMPLDKEAKDMMTPFFSTGEQRILTSGS